MLFESYEHVQQFIERGGDVLYAIMFLILVMWLFIIERFIFIGVIHKFSRRDVVAQWQERLDHGSWHAHQIRHDLIMQLRMGLNDNMHIIKMVVGLCPLMGLLGTVTGMIEVFEVMAFLGNGSPKAMASGISKATIPTMAGMVGALTGVFAQYLLSRFIQREHTHLEHQFAFETDAKA